MNLGYVSFKNILYISPQYTLTKNRPFGIKYFGQGLQVSYIVWNYNFFWDNVRLIFRIIFFEREKKRLSLRRTFWVQGLYIALFVQPLRSPRLTWIFKKTIHKVYDFEENVI